MVKSKSDASSNYEAGLKRIGVDAYRRASEQSSPSEAAEILEDAKNERLSISDMVDAYERAY